MNTSRQLRVRALWLAAWLVACSPAAFAQNAPKKVTRAEALSALANKVEPDYPAMARQLRVQGEVDLEVHVAENGDVVKVDIIKGNPMLTAAGAEAVKHWKFHPFLEDGKPVAVLAPVTLIFKI